MSGRPSRADRVDQTSRHVHGVTGSDGDLPQKLSQGSVRDAAFVFAAGGLALPTDDQLRIGRSGEDVPALGLPERLMFDALCIAVVRMHLHRQPVVRGDDLRENGEDARRVEVTEKPFAESFPKHRDGGSLEYSVGDGVSIPAFPRFAEFVGCVAVLAILAHQFIATPYRLGERGSEFPRIYRRIGHGHRW